MEPVPARNFLERDLICDFIGRRERAERLGAVLLCCSSPTNNPNFQQLSFRGLIVLKEKTGKVKSNAYRATVASVSHQLYFN